MKRLIIKSIEISKCDLDIKTTNLINRINNRFLNKGECLVDGNHNKCRYVPIKISISRDISITVKAHHIWFLLYKGELKNNICHSCDNTKCINPKHLWQGTQRDNCIDCVNKGRSNKPTGERHHRNILKEKDVIKIYKMKSRGLFATEIGEKLGYSTSLVQHCMSGRTWKKYYQMDIMTMRKVSD